MSTRARAVTVVAVVLGILLAPAAGWALEIVVPKRLTSVAGNAQMGNPLACLGGAGERYQQVYDRGELATGLITAIAFRREDTLIFPDNAPITIPNVTITLSSTDAQVDGLSPTFASNIGADVVTVFSGTVTSFSQISGPGLKPFDTVVSLTTPFSFDVGRFKNLLLDITVASCPVNALISFDVADSAFPEPPDSVSIVRGAATSSTGLASTRGLVTQFTVSTPPAIVVAAVLPGSRSVGVGQPATAFASIIVAGSSAATGCAIAPINAPAGTGFSYQQTSGTNVVVGTPNTPVDIPGGGSIGTFVISLTPSVAFPATEIHFNFQCTNSDPAPDTPGVNTLLLTASSSPTPDIIAIAVAVGGFVTIPGSDGTGALAVATVNVGVGAPITVTADTGSATLPVTLSVCQTNPGNGQCINPGAPVPSVTTQINTGQTPTFTIFAQASGPIPFSPGINRIYVRFKTQDGATVGSTSVAVRTQ